jgi:hypothetical protein
LPVRVLFQLSADRLEKKSELRSDGQAGGLSH